MVDLLGGLIVPGAPRRTAIERDDGALVEAEQNALAIRGIDPHLLRVVAAGRTLEAGEGVAAVSRFVARRVDRIDNVRVLRVDVDAAVVPALAVVNSLIILGHLAPGCPTIIRAI